MTESQELLAAYVQTGSETAFRELLRRYLDLVYSSALRLVDGDTHRAEDVSQMVFADLAQMASKLSRDTMLGGWLHRHACFVARNVMRSERRRQARERKVAEMESLNTQLDEHLRQLAPILDEAIQELGADDRDAILLRFFEQRKLSSVGEALGISENVAQKRVARALEELEILLKRKGLALSAAALSGCLADGVVNAAPATLAGTIAVSIFSAAGATGSLAAGTAKAVTMTKAKISLVAALMLAAGGSIMLIRTRSYPPTPCVSPPNILQSTVPQTESASRAAPAIQNSAPEVPNDTITSRATDAPIPTPRDVVRSPAVSVPEKNDIPPAPPSQAVIFPNLTRLDARSGGKLRIEGTSTLHNWQVESPIIIGFLEVGPEFPIGSEPVPNAEKIQAHGEVSILVRSLRSIESDGKYYSDAMDNKMWEMMNLSTYPKITYRLSELALKELPKQKGDPYIFDSQGELVVSGRTNQLAMEVNILPLGEIKGEERFKISGATVLKMTHFGISPNSIVISKTGDDMTINFDWIVGEKISSATVK